MQKACECMFNNCCYCQICNRIENENCVCLYSSNQVSCTIQSIPEKIEPDVVADTVLTSSYRNVATPCCVVSLRRKWSIE